MADTVKLRHTAAQVDDGIDKANAAAPKSTVYTKTEVDTALAAKADSSDVYDKDAVDELLEGKVDVETGKGLSTNDYTNAEKAKLASLENYDDTEVKASITEVEDAVSDVAQEVETARGTYASLDERLDDMGGGGGGTSNYNQLTNKPSINNVTLTGNKTTSDLGIVENVQANWNETDSTAPSYIQNKPNIPSGVVVDTTYDGTSENAQAGTAVAQAVSTKVDKVTGKGLSENDYTNADKAKLDGIETGAEANVQANWTQTDTTADDYIKNKPTIPTVNDATLTIQKNGTAVGTFSANAATAAAINITVPVDAADVDALPDTTKYGASLALSIDSSTYVVTATLKDQDGNTLGTAQTIDLPLETVVVGGSYDDTTKKVILTLKNGNTIDFSVADLVAGLQTEITSTNKLDADLVDDTTSAHKFVTAADKTAWNAKSDFSGDYDDLTNKPTIPAAQVNADWNATSGVAQILNKPTIPTPVIVDQTYNAQSANAQSGTAVAQALGAIPTVTVDQTYNPSSSNAQSGAAIAETWIRTRGVYTVTIPTTNFKVKLNNTVSEIPPTGSLCMCEFSYTSLGNRYSTGVLCCVGLRATNGEDNVAYVDTNGHQLFSGPHTSTTGQTITKCSLWIEESTGDFYLTGTIDSLPTGGTTVYAEVQPIRIR